MAYSDRQRHRQVEEKLAKGEIPVLKKYLPGIERLLEKYNVPRDSVFIPDPHVSREENERQRKAWKERKRYVKEKIKHGTYNPQGSLSRDEKTRLKAQLSKRLGLK